MTPADTAPDLSLTPPDLGELAVELRVAVMRTARVLRNQASSDVVTPGQTTVLALLAKRGPQTMRQLADAERVQAPSMTRTVNALSAQNLFERTDSPSDGRQVVVALTDAGGAPVGQARRRELSLELMGPGSNAVLARIERTSKEELAFPIETVGGERLGVLTKQKLETSAPSISQMVFAPQLASNTVAFQATMHLGFAGSREYHLLVERRPESEQLATLVGLTPVIAAYAY